MWNPTSKTLRPGGLALGAALLTIATMTVLSGCSRKPVLRMNGVKVYEHVWDRTLAQLAPQAAYEMQCGEENLSYALFRKRGRHPTQIGVQGCGQRVIYQRRGRRAWTMVAEEVDAQPVYREEARPQPRVQPPAHHRAQPGHQPQTRPQPRYQRQQPAVPPHDHPHTHEDADEYDDGREDAPLPPPARYPGT